MVSKSPRPAPAAPALAAATCPVGAGLLERLDEVPSNCDPAAAQLGKTMPGLLPGDSEHPGNRRATLATDGACPGGARLNRRRAAPGVWIRAPAASTFDPTQYWRR
jgi:hypothetical protein